MAAATVACGSDDGLPRRSRVDETHGISTERITNIGRTQMASIPQIKASPDFEEFFGDPPVLYSEREDDYRTLAQSVVLSVKPRDSFEMLLLRDFVDHAWSSERYKRMKAAMLDVQASGE
jgi:hypothetical protein